MIQSNVKVTREADAVIEVLAQRLYSAVVLRRIESDLDADVSL